MSRLTKAALILLLEIVLILPAIFHQRIDRGFKTLEDYWSETGLNEKELEGLLSDEACYSEQKAFLACANALSMMAERYNRVLSVSGHLAAMTKKEIEQRLTEKKELSPWVWIYQTSQLQSENPDFVIPVSFFKVWQQLKTEFIQPKEKAAVVALGINGFLSIYKDPHTYIIPLAYYEDVVAKSEARASNMGFIARRVKNYAVIRKVFEGSAASLAGLKKGDKILRINGLDIAQLHPSQYNEILKVRQGDRLGLTVERNQNGKIFEKYFEIIKSENQLPNVVSKMLNGPRRAGLLTIHKFAKDTCVITKSHLVSLMEQGLQGLMLDLRDNPGGQVEEAACIINLFVEKGTPLFETRYLDLTKSSEKYVAENKVLYRGPMAVLVNSGSASASEIVAGSLKDLGRATLVGERTFGKGTFQDGRIWGANSKIAMFETEGMYYFPSGWTPQLVGLEPDINVAFNNADLQREEELFFNPLRPLDFWNGPQSLTWLQQQDCEDNSPVWKEAMPWSEDPQIQKATDWLSCHNPSRRAHDRNGAL